MVKVKEFNSDTSIADTVNKWLNTAQVKVIDIKYSADLYSSNALIIYEED
jgi:hypothetical protein